MKSEDDIIVPDDSVAAVVRTSAVPLASWPLLIVSAVIGGVAGVLSVLLARWINNHGGDDSPEKHGISGVQACRLGGVLVAGYVLISSIYNAVRSGGILYSESTLWILLVGALFFAIGLFEDIKGILSARVRLVSMLLGTGLILSFYQGLVLEPVGLPGFDWLLGIQALALPFTLLCIVFLPNAFNAADGANGLISGTSMIVLFAIGQAQLADLNLLLNIVAISCLIFLMYNVVTARVYLGDGGAYFLGAMVGCAMIITANSQQLPVWYLLALIFYPVAEFLWSILRRIAIGKSPMAADNLHFHNLLFAELRDMTGWQVRANTVVGVGIAVVFAGTPCALWLLGANDINWMLVYCLQWTVYIVLWIALRRKAAKIEKD